MNVGSGEPTDLITLAKRVIALVDSASQLRIEAAREVEVSRFVADTTLLTKKFAMQPIEDPLYHLPELIDSIRKDRATTQLDHTLESAREADPSACQKQLRAPSGFR